MQRLSPGPVLYLVPATRTGRRNDRRFRLALNSREQHEITNLHRDVIMLPLIPERTRHSATPGRQYPDGKVFRQA